MNSDGYILKSNLLRLIESKYKDKINSELYEDIRNMNCVDRNIVVKYIDSESENCELILCGCYEEKEREKPLYNRITGKIDGYYTECYGICNGTREKDEVRCNGNQNSRKCVYYED